MASPQDEIAKKLKDVFGVTDYKGIVKQWREIKKTGYTPDPTLPTRTPRPTPPAAPSVGDRLYLSNANEVTSQPSGRPLYWNPQDNTVTDIQTPYPALHGTSMRLNITGTPAPDPLVPKPPDDPYQLFRELEVDRSPAGIASRLEADLKKKFDAAEGTEKDITKLKIATGGGMGTEAYMAGLGYEVDALPKLEATYEQQLEATEAARQAYFKHEGTYERQKELTGTAIKQTQQRVEVEAELEIAEEKIEEIQARLREFMVKHPTSLNVPGSLSFDEEASAELAKMRGEMFVAEAEIEALEEEAEKDMTVILVQDKDGAPVPIALYDLEQRTDEERPLTYVLPYMGELFNQTLRPAHTYWERSVEDDRPLVPLMWHGWTSFWRRFRYRGSYTINMALQEPLANKMVWDWQQDPNAPLYSEHIARTTNHVETRRRIDEIVATVDATNDKEPTTWQLSELKFLIRQDLSYMASEKIILKAMEAEEAVQNDVELLKERVGADEPIFRVPFIDAFQEEDVIKRFEEGQSVDDVLESTIYGPGMVNRVFSRWEINTELKLREEEAITNLELILKDTAENFDDLPDEVIWDRQGLMRGWAEVMVDSRKARTDVTMHDFRYTWALGIDGDKAEEAARQAIIDATVQLGHIPEAWQMEEITARFAEAPTELAGDIIFDPINLIPNVLFEKLFIVPLKGLLKLPGKGLKVISPLGHAALTKTFRTASLRTAAIKGVSGPFSRSMQPLVKGFPDHQALKRTLVMFAKDPARLVRETILDHKDILRLQELVETLGIHQDDLAKIIDEAYLVASKERQIHLTLRHERAGRDVAEHVIEKEAADWVDSHLQNLVKAAGDMLSTRFIDDHRVWKGGITDEGLLAALAKWIGIGDLKAGDDMLRMTILGKEYHRPLLKNVGKVTAGREAIMTWVRGTEKIRSVWTSMILSARPGFTVINYLDSTLRAVLHGANPFDKLSDILLRLGDDIPHDLERRFRGSYIGDNLQLVDAILAGEIVDPSLYRVWKLGTEGEAAKVFVQHNKATARLVDDFLLKITPIQGAAATELKQSAKILRSAVSSKDPERVGAVLDILIDKAKASDDLASVLPDLKALKTELLVDRTGVPLIYKRWTSGWSAVNSYQEFANSLRLYSQRLSRDLNILERIIRQDPRVVGRLLDDRLFMEIAEDTLRRNIDNPTKLLEEIKQVTKFSISTDRKAWSRLYTREMYYRLSQTIGHSEARQVLNSISQTLLDEIGTTGKLSKQTVDDIVNTFIDITRRDTEVVVHQSDELRRAGGGFEPNPDVDELGKIMAQDVIEEPPIPKPVITPPPEAAVQPELVPTANLTTDIERITKPGGKVVDIEDPIIKANLDEEIEHMIFELEGGEPTWYLEWRKNNIKGGEWTKGTARSKNNQDLAAMLSRIKNGEKVGVWDEAIRDLVWERLRSGSPGEAISQRARFYPYVTYARGGTLEEITTELVRYNEINGTAYKTIDEFVEGTSAVVSGIDTELAKMGHGGVLERQAEEHIRQIVEDGGGTFDPQTLTQREAGERIARAHREGADLEFTLNRQLDAIPEGTPGRDDIRKSAALLMEARSNNQKIISDLMEYMLEKYPGPMGLVSGDAVVAQEMWAYYKRLRAHMYESGANAMEPLLVMARGDNWAGLSKIWDDKTLPSLYDILDEGAGNLMSFHLSEDLMTLQHGLAKGQTFTLTAPDRELDEFLRILGVETYDDWTKPYQRVPFKAPVPKVPEGIVGPFEGSTISKTNRISTITLTDGREFELRPVDFIAGEGEVGWMWSAHDDLAPISGTMFSTEDEAIEKLTEIVGGEVTPTRPPLAAISPDAERLVLEQPAVPQGKGAIDPDAVVPPPEPNTFSDAQWEIVRRNNKLNIYSTSKYKGEPVLDSPQNMLNFMREQEALLLRKNKTEQALRLREKIEAVEKDLRVYEFAQGHVDGLVPPYPREYDLPPGIQTYNKIVDDATDAELHLEEFFEELRTHLHKSIDDGSWYVTRPSGPVRDGLNDWARAVSEIQVEGLDAVKHGGTVAGTNFEGAVNVVNKVMLDYTDYMSWEKFIKSNLMPFWMFPTRSIPFWIETMLSNPKIPAFYMKYLEASRRYAYELGGITRDGRQLPSLAGYMPLSNGTWINPIAAWSGRYAIPRENIYFDQDETISPMQEVVTYVWDMMNMFGMSPYPHISMLAYSQGWVDSAERPPRSVNPFIDLVPPNWQRFLHGTMDRSLYPGQKEMYSFEVDWKDDEIEIEMLTWANEEMSLPNMTLAQKQTTGNMVERAILYKNSTLGEWALEDDTLELTDLQAQEIADQGWTFANPDPQGPELYLRMREKFENREWANKFAGWFTSIYGKQYTNADALLTKHRNYISMLQKGLNDLAVAHIFDLDPMAEGRNQFYIDQKYNEPTGWLANLRSRLGFAIYEDPRTGEITEAHGPERDEYVSQIITEEQQTRARFEALAMERDTRNELLAAQGPGAPYEKLAPIYEDYWTKIGTIESATIYDAARKEYFIGYKPRKLVRNDIENMYWYTVLRLAPTYHREGDDPEETWTDFQIRYDKWFETDLPILAETSLEFWTKLDQIEWFAPELNKPENIVGWIKKISNREGYEAWKVSNDSISEAESRVWLANVQDKYYTDVAGHEGGTADRLLAEGEFYDSMNAEHSVADRDWGPSLQQMIVWTHEMYPDRFTSFQIAQELEGRHIWSMEERLQAKREAKVGSERSNLEEQIWMEVNKVPTGGTGEFGSAIIAAGGDKDDVNTWWDAGGRTKDIWTIEELVELRDQMREANRSLSNVEPDKEELQSQSKAYSLNTKFREIVTAQFGEDFWRVLAVYGDMNSTDKRAFREEEPALYKQIDFYYDMKDQYAEDHPDWAEYYHSSYDPDKAKKGTGVGGVSGRGAATGPGVAPSRAPGTYIPLGYRSTLDANRLLAPGQVGRGGAGGRLVWPKQFVEIVGPEMIEELDNLLDPTKKAAALTSAAVQFLSGVAKRYKEKYEPMIREILRVNEARRDEFAERDKPGQGG